MKDPAFLFYPNDYIGGTMGMTFEEKGAYIDLLMMQFNRGHMTSHMIGQTVGQIWDKIQCKFTQDANGLWYNERLELEINKRKAFVGSRRNNLKGVNQYTKKSGHMDGHMTSHMENENENINIDTNKEVVDFEAIKNFYNKTCTNLVQCKTLTPKRKTYIQARMKEYGKESIVKVIKDAAKAPFLNGENDRNWRADIEWLFKLENFVKIMEGKYKDAKPKQHFIPTYERLDLKVKKL